MPEEEEINWIFGLERCQK